MDHALYAPSSCLGENFNDTEVLEVKWNINSYANDNDKRDKCNLLQ